MVTQVQKVSETNLKDEKKTLLSRACPGGSGARSGEHGI
jgi:hypothetical protein